MKYVVLDFEMNRVPRAVRKRYGYDYGSEIIQIGAVVIENGIICDEYNAYVRPEYCGITQSIRLLTGITDQDVAKAPTIEEALADFMEWLPEDCVLVSWSDSDQKQVIKEASLKGIMSDEVEAILDSWIDCQELFAEKVNIDRKYRLSEALVIADIDFSGNAHDGLVDAKNTALLFDKLLKPDFEPNEVYMASQEEEVEHLSMNIGDMFGDILAACA